MAAAVKAITGGSVVTALGAISFAVSQMYGAHEQTERLRIEMDAKAICESQQIEDSDYLNVLREGTKDLADRLIVSQEELVECLKR